MVKIKVKVIIILLPCSTTIYWSNIGQWYISNFLCWVCIEISYWSNIV